MSQPLLWQYVPIGDYEPPEGMVAESLKGGIAGFWKRLTASGKERDKDLSFTSPEQLKSLPETLLNAAVPAPDWKGALSALDRTLTPWLGAAHA